MNHFNHNSEQDGLIRKKKRLGDLLIDQKIINETQLNVALNQQKLEKRKLGEVLVALGYTTETEIAHALQKQLGIEAVSLSAIRIQDDILRLVPDPALLKKYVMMPYAFDSQNGTKLKVAMENPMDIIAVDDLSIVTNTPIDPVIATASEILAAIDRYYGSKEALAVAEQYSKERDSEYQMAKEDTSAAVSNAPIVVLVKTIIEQAVRQRASDIHLEPLEAKIRVRYRIDGALQEAGSYPVNMLSAIVARIKIIGGMDISEKRKPQDGRITQLVDQVEYDIRVSILPTVFGEKIVMRLAAKMALKRDKKFLGFSAEELNQFDHLLANPHGILLVSGPTGSGKSTTLYTALSELNREEVNIITVEDPVEANIDGINQVQVNPKAELTFASALRSILRQDPDIIMIGEIRDAETASIAVTASITGHLVVSSIHTNSAASSITRLVNMGIEPYLIADAMVGVIAQRLVRRLCTCKKKVPLSDRGRHLLSISKDAAVEIYEPNGCPKCNETGYLGRIGVYEIMPVTNAIKSIISRGRTAEEIEAQALKEGMHTLKMSAQRLVLQGVTSLEEMQRIAYTNDEESL